VAESIQCKCPVCEEKFELDPDTEIGGTTCCPGCYSDLKITNLNPIKLEEDISSYDNDHYEDEDENEDY